MKCRYQCGLETRQVSRRHRDKLTCIRRRNGVECRIERDGPISRPSNWTASKGAE
jgi:hypothetical protein